MYPLMDEFNSNGRGISLKKGLEAGCTAPMRQ